MSVNYNFDAYEVTIERRDKNLDNSAKMWNGYSDGPIQDNYTKVFFDWKDWRGGADWTVTEVGTCTQTLVDIAGGGLALATGGTEDNGISMQWGKGSDGTGGEWVKPAAGKNIYFEFKMAIDDATQSDIFIGLSPTDTAITASLPTDVIGFLKADGSTDFTPISRASSSSTTTTSTVTPGTNLTKKYGFKVTGLTSVEFYVDDALVATHTTNIPTTEMRPSVEVLTGEANAATMTMYGKFRVAAQN